jgi:site-specific DNA recombinase
MAALEVLAGSRTDNLDDLAAEIGYGREHAADLLKVGFLAPDIITAILDGRQPEDLTRTKLIRWAGLPLDWVAQRVALGFAVI